MKPDPKPKSMATGSEQGESPLIRLKGFSISAGISLVAFALILLASRGQSSVAGELTAVPTLGWPDLILVAILLIVFSGLYVASQTAIECLRPHHVKFFKEEGQEEKARRLQKLIERQASYIAATTIGCQTARFLLVITAVAAAPKLEAALNVAGTTGLIGSILLIAVPLLILNMILELVPKSYAALHPIKVGLFLYRFTSASSLIFSVPAAIATAVANLLTARFGGNASFVIANQAEEEIKTIVESAQESGEIEEEEREMLHSVFEFSDTVVREVMTPRVDIDALSVECSPEEVLNLIKETGHSRIPLFEQTDDAIVGIVHAKDLLMAMLSDRKLSLKKLMRAPIFVPENKDLHDLLREMRQSHTQMAIVQDEFGGTSGLVTIEDIVEEVVGDIVDEYDQEEPEITAVEGGWLVDGRTHIDDVAKATGYEPDDEEFDTIGGLVFGLFGRQPNKGESIASNEFNFTVADTDGRRIQRVLVATSVPSSSEASKDTRASS